MPEQPPLGAQTDAPIFVSYSRVNADFARDLCTKLRALRFNVWRDRDDIIGGEDWWNQIQDAIKGSETMVLLMSPKALESPIVAKEWRYARQIGTRVIPVVAEDVNFSVVPRWMKALDWLDFREGVPDADIIWAKFITQLNAPYQRRRVPFMAGDLPADFVLRPEKYEAVTGLLLDEKREEPVAITAALRGAGGFGKTTLARAICHDDDVQQAFDDGIIWVELGEKPGDLTGRVLDLIEVLSGERPGFTGLEAATVRLAELLAERDILMVIDDVWDSAHLKPFLRGGERCARLITTRNTDTLPLEVKKIPVDAMKPEEATALLGAQLPTGELEALSALANRLGEWPLLLKLVNGVLRNRVELGQTLKDALMYVNTALDRRGLTVFDATNSTERHHAVAATMGLSLEQLKEQERARYNELAIFPEDVDVPLAALAKLWGAAGGMDEFDSEHLCEHLYRLSLLLSFDPARRNIRLHDVMRSYLMETLDMAVLKTLHGCFLSAYSVEQWANLPSSELYLWDWLAFHLLEAGNNEELHKLLTDSGAWMDAKSVARAGDRAYVNDLELVLTLYMEKSPLNADELVKIVELNTARQVVHARVSRYTEGDLTTLVRLGRKTEALNLVGLRPESFDKFRGLLTIYTALEEKEERDFALLNEMEALARSAPASDSRTIMLSVVAVLLWRSGNERANAIFEEVWKLIPTIQDDFVWGQTLHNLAGILKDYEQPVDLTTIASSAENEILRLDSMYRLSVWLADKAEQLGRAEEFARSIPDVRMRLRALGGIAEVIALQNASQANALFEELEVTALMLDDSETRAQIFRDLVSALSKAKQFDSAYRLINYIKSHEGRAYALVELGEAVAASNQITRASRIFTEAREVTHSIVDKWPKGNILSRLAIAFFNSEDSHAIEMLEEAKRAARDIPDLSTQAAVLRNLASGLAGIKHEQALAIFQEALVVAQAIQGGGMRPSMIGSIIEALAEAGYFDHAELAAHSIEDDVNQASAMNSIIKVLIQKGMLTRAKELVDRIRHDGLQAAMRKEIAESLSKAGDHEASTFLDSGLSSLTKEETLYWDHILIRMIDTLAEMKYFVEAEKLIHHLEASEQKDEALHKLVTELASASHFDQARKLALRIQDDIGKSHALSEIVAQLARAGRLDEAEELAHQISDDRFDIYLLAHRALQLAQSGGFDAALDLVLGIHEENDRTTAQRILTRELAEHGFYAEARQIAQVIENQVTQGILQQELARMAAETNHYDEADAIAYDIRDGERRAVALGILALSLIDAGHVARAEILVQTINTSDVQRSSPHILARVWASLGKFEEAERLISQIQDAETQVYTLITLAARMAQAGDKRSDDILERAITVAQDVENEHLRSHKLSAIADTLAELGQYDKASTIAASIPDENIRLESLREIVKLLVKNGHYNMAREWVYGVQDHTIQNHRIKKRLLFTLATTQVWEGNYLEAFNVLGMREMGEYLEILLEWLPRFEQVEPRVSLNALGQAIRVMSWHGRQWERIFPLFVG